MMHGNSNIYLKKYDGNITVFAAAVEGTRSVADSDISHVEYRYIKINMRTDFYNTDQKEDGVLDDQRRDGGTKTTLRTKEQRTHLTLNEHDDDDEQTFTFQRIVSAVD